MKKITILALHLGFGGVENAIISLGNILSEKYEVEIISTYKLYDKPVFDLNENIKVRYLIDDLKPNKKEFLKAIKSFNIPNILKEGFKSLQILYLRKNRMINAIKEINSDIIVSTRLLHNKWLSKYGNKSSVKCAQEHKHHNNDKRYVKRLIKSCYNIDFFLPVSRELTDFYAKKFTSKKTECVYIPHCLEEVPIEISNLSGKNILSIGRLAKEKGFSDLIDVFNLLLEKHPNWKLNIIGDGEERDSLQNKISSLCLNESIILHGFRGKKYIADMMKKSSIYVMTSFEESFGLVLIEAQSFGLPCVAFDSAQGAKEIIDNNINGFLISNRDKTDMVNKISKLIKSRELLCNFSKESRINSLKYSKENIKLKWIDFIDNIV